MSALDAWAQSLVQTPWRTDFYVAMRRIEGAYRDLPRLGESRSARTEAIRLGQEPALTFAPANLHSVDWSPAKPKLTVRFLGLFGPMGALPTYVSEVALDRRRAGDPTLTAFADVFHHRLISFFYRAWRQSQPAASRDHPGSDQFAHYIGALVGIGTPATQDRDAVQDDAKRYFSGQLSSMVRSEARFLAASREYFSVPIRLDSLYPRWVRLAEEERSRTARRFATLGRDVVLGARVYEAQSHIRLVVGPMSYERYQAFLPGGRSLQRLRSWIHHFFGPAISARIQLVLQREEVPLGRLDGRSSLGRTCWIGPGAGRQDRGDLELGENHV